jgi:hypothetical protein
LWVLIIIDSLLINTYILTYHSSFILEGVAEVSIYPKTHADAPHRE